MPIRKRLNWKLGLAPLPSSAPPRMAVANTRPPTPADFFPEVACCSKASSIRSSVLRVRSSSGASCSFLRRDQSLCPLRPIGTRPRKDSLSFHIQQFSKIKTRNPRGTSHSGGLEINAPMRSCAYALMLLYASKRTMRCRLRFKPT